MSKEAKEMVILFVLASTIVGLALLGVYGGFLKNLYVFGAGMVLMVAPFLSTPVAGRPSNRGIKFGMTLGTALFIASFCVGPIHIGSWVLY